MSKKFYLECDCGSPDHCTVIERIDFTGEDGELYEKEIFIYAALNHYLPWYKRIIPAFKYILGIDNTHTYYTDTSISLDRFNTIVSGVNEEYK